MDETQAPVSGKKETIVYADIGPMSLKKRNSVPSFQLADNRIEYAQLTVHMDSDIKLKNINHQLENYSPDRSLDLDSLLIQLKPAVTDQWYQFGEAIGVKKDLLDKCAQYSPEENMVEILDNWLRNHEGQPTWKEVADGLDKIGLCSLAADIRNVYKTGKLPIEVNMGLTAGMPINCCAESQNNESPPPIPPRMYTD